MWSFNYLNVLIIFSTFLLTFGVKVFYVLPMKSKRLDTLGLEQRHNNWNYVLSSMKSGSNFITSNERNDIMLTVLKRRIHT